MVADSRLWRKIMRMKNIGPAKGGIKKFTSSMNKRIGNKPFKVAKPRGIPAIIVNPARSRKPLVTKLRNKIP